MLVAVDLSRISDARSISELGSSADISKYSRKALPAASRVASTVNVMLSFDMLTLTLLVAIWSRASAAASAAPSNPRAVSRATSRTA
jgi:hypothetical protein